MHSSNWKKTDVFRFMEWGEVRGGTKWGYRDHFEPCKSSKVL